MEQWDGELMVGVDKTMLNPASVQSCAVLCVGRFLSCSGCLFTFHLRWCEVSICFWNPCCNFSIKAASQWSQLSSGFCPPTFLVPPMAEEPADVQVCLACKQKEGEFDKETQIAFAVDWRMPQYAALLARKYPITQTSPCESIRVLGCFLHHAMMSWILKESSSTGYRW